MPTPVILEAAINGTTTKARNPHVPRTPAEITADALACIEVGAALVHNHTDDPIFDGVTAAHSPAPYIEAWRPVLEKHPDAFLYPTMTGGGPHTTIAQRYGHLPAIARAGCLTMGIVDPGSVNIGTFDADGQPSTHDTIYQNSNADVRHMIETCDALAVPINFSIFDGSFMRTAAAYIRAGRVRHGGIVKIFFGSPFASFGIPATETALAAYLEMLSDCELPWSIAIPGGDLLSNDVAGLALERGGHLRVGLEDYAGPGQPTNVEILERAARLCSEIRRPLARGAQAADLMKVPTSARRGQA
ncbi:3-keto-5-aminohexanoate cleavage protein [Myxococcota bacterium]|nr:3-keto-5-aminohexanoate cleavage protein [Myxococcota bacterium]